MALERFGLFRIRQHKPYGAQTICMLICNFYAYKQMDDHKIVPSVNSIVLFSLEFTKGLK